MLKSLPLIVASAHSFPYLGQTTVIEATASALLFLDNGRCCKTPFQQRSCLTIPCIIEHSAEFRPASTVEFAAIVHTLHFLNNAVRSISARHRHAPPSPTPLQCRFRRQSTVPQSVAQTSWAIGHRMVCRHPRSDIAPSFRRPTFSESHSPPYSQASPFRVCRHHTAGF